MGEVGLDKAKQSGGCWLAAWLWFGGRVHSRVSRLPTLAGVTSIIKC